MFSVSSGFFDFSGFFLIVPPETQSRFGNSEGMLRKEKT
jgi:hypothetical protein